VKFCFQNCLFSSLFRWAFPSVVVAAVVFFLASPVLPSSLCRRSLTEKFALSPVLFDSLS